MQLDTAGRELIERWEGRRATAYLDTGGVATIGIGHAIRPGEGHLHTATLSDAEIDAIFAADVAWAEEAVARLFPGVVHQSQFNALVSFTFNLGETQVAGSTLRDVINGNGTPAEVKAQWMRWVNDAGHVVQGLVNRRAVEVQHYFGHLASLSVLLLIIAALFMLSTGVYLITA